MGIKLDWGDFDETFLIMRFEGNWSAEDYYGAIQQMYRLVGQNQEHLVELMVDMRNSLTPPQNLVTMVRSTLNRPPSKRFKQVVVISPSRFWSRIFSIVEKVYSSQLTAAVHFVDTVDEAYSMLDVYKGYV